MIERIEEDIIKVKSTVSLSEIYDKFPDKQMFVEPLSTHQSVGDFLKEGGFGWGSLRDGSLGAKIYKLRANSGMGEFEYGTGYFPLYNVGYPLHRQMVGPHNSNNFGKIGEIKEITFPLRKKERVNIIYKLGTISEVKIPDCALSSIYLNKGAAKLFGLSDRGLLSVFPPYIPLSEETKNDLWKNRFFEDKIKGKLQKFFTVNSNLEKIEGMMGKNDIFAVLFTQLGPVVIVSTEKNIEGNIGGLPFTYKLYKKQV